MPLSRVSFSVLNHPPPDFHWFHIILTVYGAWLPGDSRGFRTRHHREHIEGDYKSPPPVGMYTARLQRSGSLLTQSPVHLASQWRMIVGMAMIHRLSQQGGFVMGAAVASQHAHLLAKLPKSGTRHRIGNAKRHAWFAVRERGWQKKLWAKRGKFTPVNDRRHLDNTLRYIIAHEQQGAWVWAWDGLSDQLVERLRA